MDLTDQQIVFLKNKWPIDSEIKFHRRVANFVYFTTIHEADVVLRLTEQSRRKKTEIEAELDWMNYLSTNGMQIASPIKTQDESFVVELPGDKIFYASMFKRAPGSSLKDNEAPSIV